MTWYPDHLLYRIAGSVEDGTAIWLHKNTTYPNGNYGLPLTCPGGQPVDCSDPRTFMLSNPKLEEAKFKAEETAVWKALNPTLLPLERNYGLEIKLGDLDCIHDGYNAAWTQVKRIFESHLMGSPSGTSNLLIDGQLRDESLLFKLDQWYGLIEDYRFAPNWPATMDRRDSRGFLVQNPDAFACKRCVNRQLLCHGHRERIDQICDPCHAAGATCSKTLAENKTYFEI